MPNLYLSAHALSSNYRFLKSKTNSMLIPVLKADAYGHGALFSLNVLLSEGASLFAVSNAYEALELINFIEKSKYSFTNKRILVMSSVEEAELFPLLSPHVILSVHSPAEARRLSKTIEKYKASYLLPSTFHANVHLKLETGMHRTGLRSENAVRYVRSLPHLSIEGVYSHFAYAKDEARTEEQLSLFLSRTELFPKGLFTHLSASEGLLRYGDFSLSAVRCGLALFGIPPDGINLPLLPVMRFSARVLAVFTLKKGEYIGYGETVTHRSRRIAVIDAGYADGIPPTAHMGGWVRIRGQKCPFFGSVCMDKSTVDIGSLPLAEGDEITLFGEKAGDTARFAHASGISPYVLLSLRSARTRRIYLMESE